MPLSSNEIMSRALNFSRTSTDASYEDSEVRPFWIALFELNVRKHGGGQGFVALFWPGMLLVEQKLHGNKRRRSASASSSSSTITQPHT